MDHRDDRSAGGDGEARDLRSERRRTVLRIVAAAEAPLSTTELARLTGQTLGATAHHVRALARDGYLRWAGERRVRGALQTFYVASDAGLAAARRQRVDTLLELAGVPGVRLHVALDERAMRQLEDLLDDLLPRVLAILERL